MKKIFWNKRVFVMVMFLRKLRISVRIFVVLFIFSVLPCGLLFYNTVNKVDGINEQNLENYTQTYKSLIENKLENAVYKNAVQCIKLFSNSSLTELIDDSSVPQSVRQAELYKAVQSQGVDTDGEYRIHILTENGETFRIFPDELEDINYSSEFIERIEGGGDVVFGDIVYDRNDVAYLVIGQSLNSYDFHSDDKKVLIFIKLDILDSYYESMVNDGNSGCFISDGQNRIIFSNNKELINSENIFNYCFEYGNDIRKELTFGDERYIYASEKLTFSSKNMPNDIVLNLLLPKSVYYNSVNRFFYTSSIIFLLMIILFAIIGTILSYALVKPLRRIEQSVKLFGKGVMNVKLPITYDDEVGELKNMIEAMFIQIRNLMRNNTEILEAKHKSEFEVLQAQINPHFIYNTLDSISSIAKIEGQPEIEELVYALSSFFKISLHNGDRYISIEEEIEHVKSYIKIQEIRWPGRFSVEFDVEEEILGCEIIKTILQPFVENAIKYAFEGKTETGVIKIRAFRDDKFIVFEIEDNGRGFDTSILGSDSYKGVGIKNTLNRVVYEYGKECGVDFVSKAGEGTVVRIKVLCLEDM